MTFTILMTRRITCGTNQFTCKDKQCISDLWLCDGKNDCSFGEDEEMCSCHGQHIVSDTGNVTINYNVFLGGRFVMEKKPAMTSQMRMLNFALS